MFLIDMFLIKKSCMRNGDKEKVGVFDFQSGNIQGILIHVLCMIPVLRVIAAVNRLKLQLILFLPFLYVNHLL